MKVTLQSKAGLVLINYSHAILDQELQNNGGCPEAASPDSRKIPAAQKISKISSSILFREFIVSPHGENPGYCYREYSQNLYSLDTLCLTEQTHVLRSDTTSNRINHTACQIWPTMLHISCALINSSTLKTLKYFNNLVGPITFQNPSRNIIYIYIYILLGVQMNFSFMIHLMPTWYFESFWTDHPYDNITNI